MKAFNDNGDTIYRPQGRASRFDTISSVYKTVEDRAQHVDTRSYSVHRTQRSGSVDRIHGHENLQNNNGFERKIGHWDRHGNYK